MAYNTYNDLVTSVQGYLKEDNLNSEIGDFVLLFEAVAGADLLKHPLNEVRSSITITDDVWQALPADAFAVKSVELNVATGNRWVENTANENIVRTYGQFQPGQPDYFATSNNEIRFGPVAMGDYDAEMIYWAKLDPLNSAGSNWLYANFPMLYVYGTLLQAEPWLENDPRIQVWSALYQSAKLTFGRDARSREYGGPVRSQARIRKV